MFSLDRRDVEKKEAVDEMRKEFLANVSHELKTPIALIQGYAEGLQEGVNDDPESRQFYCDVIVDEAAKMNNMVKKLLTLNQLEFGNDVVTMAFRHYGTGEELYPVGGNSDQTERYHGADGRVSSHLCLGG